MPTAAARMFWTEGNAKPVRIPVPDKKERRGDKSRGQAMARAGRLKDGGGVGWQGGGGWREVFEKKRKWTKLPMTGSACL